MVGMHADRAKNDSPTMVLDLTDQFINIKKDQYRRSLVIHVFGHALGLEHEHQRSGFWKVLDKYIDKEKMNDSNYVRTKSSIKGLSTCPYFEAPFSRMDQIYTYDPYSIMHCV